ncbi:MAG: acyl carrier protein [Bacteroidaceae bacterium]|nr:acyl carrier protein [Bacteroidaceae bacterium]
MEMNVFINKIVEQLEIENADSLNSDTIFRELEGWSSLSVMELIALYDDEFDKQIGDTEISKCKTIGDLYNLATE